MVLAYITYPTMREAQRLSRLIVKKRLAACVNIHPISSIYWWKKKLVSSREIVGVCKTVKRHVPAIMKFIRRHHSDEVPAVVVIPVIGSLLSYKRWVSDETR